MSTRMCVLEFVLSICLVEHLLFQCFLPQDVGHRLHHLGLIGDPILIGGTVEDASCDGNT